MLTPAQAAAVAFALASRRTQRRDEAEARRRSQTWVHGCNITRLAGILARRRRERPCARACDMAELRRLVAYEALPRQDQDAVVQAVERLARQLAGW